MTKKIKAVISKLGLDSHERGAKLVASALKDAGMEVVYMGSFQTPEGVVNTAIQEDANIICISTHSGEHLTLLPILMDILKEKNLESIPVIAGGVIPKENVADLKSKGVKEIFGYGTTMPQVVEYVNKICGE